MRLRIARVAAAFALWLSACDAGAPGGDDTGGVGSTDAESAGTTSENPDGASSSGEDAPSDACDEACVDTISDTGIALCHSCRCREAFDGWLPAPDEVQCGIASPIVVYNADLSGPEIALEPAPPAGWECANPSLLTGSCRQGSVLGRLEHGDTVLQWICRDRYLDLDGSVLYEDVALIGHNTRTGATCFWDDVDDAIHDDDMPALDLTTATDEERARHDAVFDFAGGDVCVQCHDHDPFIYTPYLESTGWISGAMNKGPYGMVALDGTVRPTGTQHLVSPEAGPCLTCHRLGSENTCRRFAPDAMGMGKDDGYEPEVRSAAEPGSPHWRLAHWMPSVASPIADFAMWLSTFGSARDHILECCESPGEDVGACRWEPVQSKR